MTDPTCTPDELRARAVAGDPTVVDTLFRCYREPLSRFLLSRCGHGADAEDALMDAFVAAQRGLPGYRGDASTISWLFRIAANACTRLRRGAKNDPSRKAPLDEVGELPADDLDVDALVDARTLPLREALLALDEKDRAVLLLRDAEGLTAREVAELLSLTEPAVKSRLFRARRAVQARLGPIVGGDLLGDDTDDR